MCYRLRHPIPILLVFEHARDWVRAIDEKMASLRCCGSLETPMSAACTTRLFKSLYCGYLTRACISSTFAQARTHPRTRRGSYTPTYGAQGHPLLDARVHRTRCVCPLHSFRYTSRMYRERTRQAWVRPQHHITLRLSRRTSLSHRRARLSVLSESLHLRVIHHPAFNPTPSPRTGPPPRAPLPTAHHQGLL